MELRLQMKNMNSLSLGLGLLVLIALSGSALAWSPKNSRAISQDVSTIQPTTRTMLSKASTVIESQPLMLSRRSLFQKSSSMATVTAASALLLLSNPQSASASATSPSTLPEFLYRILRVKEATQQEIRLISTGKFKDVQRANVKLAVKFMIKNYKLSDCLLGAALYLPNAKQQSAVQVGQSAVQSLQTILEYFDSSDVQNIKVGESSMGGKEALVLKGLESTAAKLDEFLAYFDAKVVEETKAKILAENDLNVQEFDSSLGSIVNLPTLK